MQENNNIPIISVTGTKGKTTTVAVIADVLRTLQKNVVKVDTTGHFVNGQRKSTLDDSKATWRLVPTVCPGRYLWEFAQNPKLRKDGVAVLECALGSSSSSGLGYRYHKVGVFLNVFEDHIGSSARIQSQADIVKAKTFSFARINPNDGYAVFNADDHFVCSALPKLSPAMQKTHAQALIPCGITFEHFDLKKHLSEGGVAFSYDNGKILLLEKDQKTIIADLALIPWTFGGEFLPSVWNIMSAAAAIYGLFDGNLPEGLRSAIEAVRLDPYGGRLTVLESKKGVKIIADYAHEKVSLAMVGDLARTMLPENANLFGVVRLANDRTDELMQETGEVVGKTYDKLIVYEKIDGYWRKPRINPASKFPEIIGRTSKMFASGIAKTNPDYEIIMREDEALARTAELANPGDVVVVIVNDDIERSINFIKEKFDADFA